MLSHGHPWLGWFGGYSPDLGNLWKPGFLTNVSSSRSHLDHLFLSPIPNDLPGTYGWHFNHQSMMDPYGWLIPILNTRDPSGDRPGTPAASPVPRFPRSLRKILIIFARPRPRRPWRHVLKQPWWLLVTWILHFRKASPNGKIWKFVWQLTILSFLGSAIVSTVVAIWIWVWTETTLYQIAMNRKEWRWSSKNGCLVQQKWCWSSEAAKKLLWGHLDDGTVPKNLNHWRGT